MLGEDAGIGPLVAVVDPVVEPDVALEGDDVSDRVLVLDGAGVVVVVCPSLEGEDGTDSVSEGRDKDGEVVVVVEEEVDTVTPREGAGVDSVTE